MPQRVPFPPICIALGFPDTEALLAHARDEYNSGERFLEFRVDYLPDPEKGILAIRKFLSRHSDCTILATCRRRQNQGKFIGSIEEQLRILEATREAGAHPVDVEIETAENCHEKLAHRRDGLPHARTVALLRRRVHLRGSQRRRGYGHRPGDRAPIAWVISCGKIFTRRPDLRCDRRSCQPLDFARGAQSRLPSPAYRFDLPAVFGELRPAEGFLRAGAGSSAGGIQRQYSP